MSDIREGPRDMRTGDMGVVGCSGESRSRVSDTNETELGPGLLGEATHSGIRPSDLLTEDVDVLAGSGEST